MHLRKLVLACGFASFALSNYASALGLGEVKLKSTLNQPLSAEVQLLDTKGLSPEQIIVSLASVGEFERNGLDFVHFYSEFMFEVALDNPGGPVVRITSRNPVREPYLNFLVEAKWTSGRLLREYTLLMDLPTFDDAVPQAVHSAQTTQAKPAEKKAAKSSDAVVAAEVQAAVDAASSEEKPEIIAEQDQPAKKSKAAADTYGPVGDKDTLWDIALSVRPDSSASVHQTMLALQRLNPDAFIRGNINLLKKGQVLRVPDSAEIRSVSKSEAVSQFNAQTAEWSGTSTSSTGLGAQLDASTRSSTERVKSEAVTGRVKLEAPTAKDKSASGQASGSNKGSGKALESELASTLEELDKAKSDKTELSSRVRDLEAQVKTMQRLVDVSNEKLRALQLNSAKQPDKAEKLPTAQTKAAAEVSAPVASQVSASIAATEASVPSTDTVKPKKPVIKPAPVVVEPEKSLVDKLFDNILWVGIGAAGILGVVGFAVMRRRKAKAEETQSYDKDSDDLFTSEPNFDAFNQTEESVVEPSADEIALLDEEDTSAVAETGDVVGEADIYIAYGKYDQAEEMLLNGLSKDPASTDIRLKLLEVYSQTQNPTEFDKHYAAILPFATGFALSRAKELRANIPGVGEFSPEVTVLAEENLEFNTDFDLDDFDAAPAETLAATTVSEDHFDFDLDLDDVSNLDDVANLVEDAGLDVPAKANYGMDFGEKADTSKAAAVGADDEFLLDFELDDTAKNNEAAAEDLSDISLALDGLDDDGLPDDVEVSSRSHEDEFSFDFNDLDADTSSLAEQVDSIKSSEFNEDEALGDDFNLEMDVNNLDLAALDNEMASFDADLDVVDDDSKPAALVSESLVSSEVVDDFNLDDLDDDLAELDAGLQGESLAELDAELDDTDFSWEEAEDATPELEPTASADDEFSLSDEEFALDDENDFDLDSAATLDANTSLQDLDAELADESLDDQLSLEDESDVDLDDLELDLDEQSFAEIEEGLEVDESLAGPILSLDDESHLDEAIEETFSEALPDIPPEAEELDGLNEVADSEVGAFDESAPLLNTAEEELADDDIFEQALSDFSAESLALDEEANMSDDDMDAELDFMADADEAATKLDLARAYMDMGDNEGARDILAEVAHEGNDQQRQEAVDLLSRIDA
jgi:pilus assembly protein FimV